MTVEEVIPATPVMPASGVLVRRVAGLVVILVVLVLVVSVLPGLDEVRARFSDAQPGWLAAMFVCALASTVSYVAALRGSLSRRIPWRASWNLGMAEQGSNVLLPTGGVGGPALGAIVMRRAGVPSSVANPRSAALFLLTSATSFVAIIIAGTTTALGLTDSTTSWVGTILPAGAALVVMVGVGALGYLPVKAPSEGDRFFARWARQAGTLLRDGVHASVVMLRERDPLVIGGCIGYLGFAIAAIAASFQAFGGGAPPIGAFVLAYTLGQVGSLIPTPGGIGGTEGGLIGMFVLYGAPAAPTAAAILAYRVFQLGLPAIFGLIAFRQIRRRLRNEELTAAVAARFNDEQDV